MRIVFLGLALAWLCQAAPAQQKVSEAKLAPLQFLLGKWEGLVRRNHSEYRQARDRPVYRHDDLMIVYVDAATKQIRAFYTDNEQHVINYGINVSVDGKSVTFLSDPQTGVPRYRLTYAVTQPNEMSVTLEVAQADKQDQFQKIVEGKVKKTG